MHSNKSDSMSIVIICVFLVCYNIYKTMLSSIYIFHRLLEEKWFDCFMYVCSSFSFLRMKNMSTNERFHRLKWFDRKQQANIELTQDTFNWTPFVQNRPILHKLNAQLHIVYFVRIFFKSMKCWGNQFVIRFENVTPLIIIRVNFRIRWGHCCSGYISYRLVF